MEKQYQVAGHVFKLALDDRAEVLESLSNYSPFETSGVQDCLFDMTMMDHASDSAFELLLDPDTERGETLIRVFRSGDAWMFEMAVCDSFPACARLYTSADFRHGQLLMLSDSIHDMVFAINNSLMLQFAFCTAGLDTLEMHASVVKHGGRGYLSLGRSGAGKSTHSRQWLKYIAGSTLLNDDNPIVRIIDGRAVVFGSPWSGKTPCYINDSCEIGGFISIVQDPENVISRMDLISSYAALYSSCSGLRFDDLSSDGLHSTLEKIVSLVPCWSLRCRPDEDAAHVCHCAVTRF